MENKFLKYIKDNDENLIDSSSLSEHEKNYSKKLLELLKNSIKDNGYINCEHDLEELCLYVEGKSENKDLLKNQILDCDNCFENYTFLKEQIDEIKNISPPFFKDKVYEKISEISLTEKIVKKSIWNIIQKNKFLKYSSGAIAASLLLFFTINPFDTNMSDFHKSKPNKSEYQEKNNYVSNETKSNIINNQNSPSISNSRSFEQMDSKSIKKIPENVIPKKKESKNIALYPKSIELKQKNNENIINSKQNIQSVTPPLVSFPKKDSEQEYMKSKAIKDIKENEFEKRQIDLPKSSSQKEVKGIIDRYKPSNIEPNIINNIPKEEDKFKQNNETSEKIESSKSDSIILDETIKNQININTDKKKGSKDLLLSNKLNSPSLNIQEQKNLKKRVEITLNKTDKSLSLNFNIKNNGFIIIKDEDNKIIYQSVFLEKGDYNKFVVSINANEKYLIYFYLDSNNNLFFDDQDIIDKETIISEN